MDREETLALLARGKDVWNTWADEMLVRRMDLEKSGQWETKKSDWRFDARAMFSVSDSPIPGNLTELFSLFSGFHFPGDVYFERISFPHVVFFDRAVFHGKAFFNHATFPSLTAFHNCTFNDEASFQGAKFSTDCSFRSAEFNHKANFSEAEFRYGSVDFGGAHFSHETNFKRTNFSSSIFDGVGFCGEAAFVDAKFKQSASFDSILVATEIDFSRVIFQSSVRFRTKSSPGRVDFADAQFFGRATYSNSVFESWTGFVGAVFHSVAFFDSAKFLGVAQFTACRFNSIAQFSLTQFARGAIFEAMECRGAFSLGGVAFSELPDFSQAHFDEAPQLDNVSVPKPKRGTNDQAARYRALKRLALQGHDHGSEQRFFADELKSHRNDPDLLLPNPLNFFRVRLVRDSWPARVAWRWSPRKPRESSQRIRLWPGGGRYWLGLAYQVLSDFGRSAKLPFFWWLLTFVAAFCFYLGKHLTMAERGHSGFTYLVTQIALWVKGFGIPKWIPDFPNAKPIDLDCIGGGQDAPAFSAAILSLQKSLVVIGAAGTEKLNQIYACLYGRAADGSPIIPDRIVAIGMLQQLFSAVLIFLLLLAIRNRFRIK